MHTRAYQKYHIYERRDEMQRISGKEGRAMKVLVACEESQRVCMAFREKGHEAYSCDIQDCSGGHPEWHIKGDVLQILNGYHDFTTQDGTYHDTVLNDEWDLIIAHPPCTYLSNVGAPRLFDGKDHTIKDMNRYQKGLEAKEFFMNFINADCDKICVENPTPSKIWALPPLYASSATV